MRTCCNNHGRWKMAFSSLALFVGLVTTTTILWSKTSAAHHRRRLRIINQYQDPKTITTIVRDEVKDDATANAVMNIPVYLVGDTRQPSLLSFLTTDLLQRYGTGRTKFIFSGYSHNCNCTAAEPLLDVHTPCLLLARAKYCWAEQLTCMYPQCKTMLLDDEKCEKVHETFDVRQYYTTNWGSEYLPLGPRMDSWESFLRIKQDYSLGSTDGRQFTLLPSSQRKFAFNAIFSQSTNLYRQKLAEIITGSKGEKFTKKHPQYPFFSSMAKEWELRTNSETTEQLHTDDYMRVVLDSVFTLSPSGHNPECFRIFEAIEAGSIPILTKDDLYATHHYKYPDRAHPCKGAMEHWYTAPLVILNTWNDLFPVVEKLLSDPASLDELQSKLRLWYEDYMRTTVSKFEDLFV